MLCFKYLFFLLYNFVYFEFSEQRHFLVKTKEERLSMENEKGTYQVSKHTLLRPKESRNDYQGNYGESSEEYNFYLDSRETSTTAVSFFLKKRGVNCFLFSL